MFTILLRTVLLFVVIIISLRLLGKRQVGELEPSELVVTVLISELAAIPMQDVSAPLATGLLPVLVLLSLELLISLATMKNPRFRAIVCGKPSIIISNGMPVQSAMKANRITIDELCEELRKQSVYDISTVKYAVLETSGQLSILLYADEQPPAAKLLNVESKDSGLFTIIINDGRLLENNMRLRGLDGRWLKDVLRKNKVSSYKDVFWLSVSENNEIFFSGKDKSK